MPALARPAAAVRATSGRNSAVTAARWVLSCAALKNAKGRPADDRPARRKSVVEPPRFHEEQRRGGGRGLWHALGLWSGGRHSDGIRRREIPALRGRAEPQARRRLA